MNDPLKFSWQPDLKSPSLIVSWSVYAGKLGPKVTDYLNRKLGGQSFAEIDPAAFFTLSGVTIEDNLIQFPESLFYACPENDLVLFKSTPPGYDWYQFLTLFLNAAEQYCQVKEIYTIGGMVTLSTHTVPREILGTFNSAKMREALSVYQLSGGTDYETPPGQRPTLNSFLLWTAQRRNIPGVSLWVPVPFYLVNVDDPQAQKKVLEFLDQRLDLGLDFSDLDEEIREQDETISEIRSAFPGIDESITRLESDIRLTEEESQTLVKEMEIHLREKAD
jgi:proteasome assembly chaperone (PAC2) family protein